MSESETPARLVEADRAEYARGVKDERARRLRIIAWCREENETDMRTPRGMISNGCDPSDEHAD